MRFISTRGGDSATFSEALFKGLAGDGGLFVPETLPDVSPFLARWRTLPYPAMVAEFLALFATDMPPAALLAAAKNAYACFPVPDSPVPLVSLNNAVSVAELFHGPTLAFKDFALQLLGQLYASDGRAVNILGATSGDTGSAAIHGMLAVPGAHCFILYPEGGVAELQERQIACTGSQWVHPISIRGSFDDAQAIVKTIFGDSAFAAANALAAVNSINIARILAQCVYYMDIVLKTGANEDNAVEVVVPTGNFGNVLAGWMLSKMGIRGLRFCVASNANAVVSTFFQTGIYRIGTVTPSLAPSMDIQQASNFERWLWWHFNADPARVRTAMSDLRNGGTLTLTQNGAPPDPAIRAVSCDDAGIRAQIGRVWRETGYCVDPHTACAFSAFRENHAAAAVVLATAHPAKFPKTIEAVTGKRPTHPSLEALLDRPLERETLPANADAVKASIARALSRR
ncbi:MAG: threonine synthase [Puniceicoccales bacterium]|jgi:threonine synthase|nr:threonine synthase [Puniceicoccales bacterium]